MDFIKDPIAVELGRRGGKKGGLSRSAAKVAAARMNGKKRLPNKPAQEYYAPCS